MIAAADPPTAVELLLRFLCDCHRAAGGAVLVVDPGGPTLRAVRSVSLQRVSSACATVPDDLVVADDYAVFPLRHRDGHVIGLLYVEAPQLVEGEQLTPLLEALTHALSQTTGQERAAQPDDRALMRRVLERARWNVSHAAKALGVTRRTVYLRMRRHGISRPRARV